MRRTIPISKRMDQLGALLRSRRTRPRACRTQDAELFAHAANGVVGLETSLGLALGLVHQG